MFIQFNFCTGLKLRIQWKFLGLRICDLDWVRLSDIGFGFTASVTLPGGCYQMLMSGNRQILSCNGTAFFYRVSHC